MKITILFLYLFALSLVLGQFGAISFGEGSATLYIHDVLLAALFVVWILESLLVSRSLKISLNLAAPIFLFAVVALSSLLWAGTRLSFEHWAFSGFYWLRWVFYAGLFFVVSDLRHKVPAVKAGVAGVLAAAGLILSLAGFVQLAWVPDFGLMAREYGWDPHRNRLLSTFFDPNFTGAFLVMTLALILSLSLCGKGNLPRRRPSLTVWVAVVILSLALFLTFSRSAWLMMGVVAAVLGILRWRWLLVFSILLALSAYFFVPRVQTRLAGITDPADSAHFRLLSWQKTAAIARDYFWTGVGFNAFRYAQADYGFFDYRQPLGGHAGAGSDSSWLLVLATTGIFGFAVYLILYLSLMLKSWRYRREPLGLALLAVLVGLIFEANFINSLFFPPIMAWLWVVAGLL